MSIRRLSWSLAAAAFCFSGAGAANAQIAVTTRTTPVSCNGGSNGSATATATGGSGNYDYVWTPSGGRNATASGLSQGSYTVIVSERANPGISASAIATITQPSLLTATTAKIDATSAIAKDGEVSVTPTGGTAPYTYLWSDGGNTETATGLGTGNYTVTVTDANTCTITRGITVGVSARAAAIPTLSEWTMILLTGLLALLGAARLGLLPAMRKH